MREDDYDVEEHEEVQEDIADLRDELEVLTTVEPIYDEVSEEALEEDQSVLESLVEETLDEQEN